MQIIRLALFFLFVQLAQSQSRTVLLDTRRDPRGEVELTLCSQNLFNHGNFKNARKRLKGLTRKKLEKKREALARRFLKANCDIVAVQEVLGKAGKGLEEGMQELVEAIRRVTGLRYKYVLGDGVDRYMRLGYLYAENRVRLEKFASFRRIELPRLLPEDRPVLFSRAPLEATFVLKGDEQKRVTLINIHFKSKAKGDADPAQLDWETLRMQMSEAVRRVVLNKHKTSLVEGSPVLVIMGDRNSHWDSASARILEGRLSLEDFEREGDCRLSSLGTALCKGDAGGPKILFSVLTSDPQLKQLEGTHRYKDSLSWLDDILIPSSSLRYAWQNAAREGDYYSGVMYEPKEASDHALVWVKLNW